MNSTNESRQYRFSGFSIRNDQQILCKQNKNIPVGTKIYYLLLTLVENAGQILSKDEIIEAVWPGQVVTDAALTKQILRLRKLLGDDNPQQPIIETHRGVGYRFTADVEALAIDQVTPGEKPAHQHSWSGYVVLAVILLAVLIFTQTRNKPIEEEKPFLAAGIPINLAIIPAANTKDWLNTGGLDYLSEMLGQHQLIHSVTPDSEWHTSDSPEKLAISLTTNSSIDYSCLISLEELEDGFNAVIKLRTENDILASTEISSKTLPELFENINKWVSINLSVRDQLDTLDNDIYTTIDHYALQSYLQGVFEIEVTGNKENALAYFQAAVNKDNEFLSAWIKLAAAHLDLGNFDMAISIANTQLGQADSAVQQKAIVELNFIKAMAYYRLRDDEASLQSIKASVAAIRNIEDPYAKLAGLKSLRFLAGMKNDWDLAETYVNESLALSELYYPLPNHLANLSLDLARLKMLQRQAPQAHQYLNEAINFYQSAGNNNGMMASLCVLNRLNLNNDFLDEGVLIASTAEAYLNTSTDLHEQACFLSMTGIIFNLRGYFDRSLEYGSRLDTLSQQTGNVFYQFLAEFNKVHMFFVQNKFAAAMQHVNSMRSTFFEDTKLPSVRFGFISVDILVSSRALPPQTAQDKMEGYLRDYPVLNEQAFPDITRARGHILLREGLITEGLDILKTAETAYRNKQDVPLANYIGYEILEQLLQHPELDYQETIDRIEAHSNYMYIFSKLKAQFKAREGNYLDAAMLMEENKLKANQLWKPEDQLLLEQYQLASR